MLKSSTLTSNYLCMHPFFFPFETKALWVKDQCLIDLSNIPSVQLGSQTLSKIMVSLFNIEKGVIYFPSKWKVGLFGSGYDTDLLIFHLSTKLPTIQHSCSPFNKNL